MNPEEIIKLGYDIIDDDHYFKEARYRTAISRIYYGLLHHIRIVKQLLYIDTLHLHSDLITKLKDSDNVLGNFLGYMRDFRTKADYLINQEVGQKTLDDFLILVRKARERLETI